MLLSNRKVTYPIYSKIKRGRFPATQAHVSNGTFECFPSFFGSGGIFDMLRRCPINATNNIRHGAWTIRTQNLDCYRMGMLCNTILFTSNCASAVGAMAVAVLIVITSWNSFTPRSTTFEINMFNIDACINNVDFDILATVCFVFVFVEGVEW